MSLVRASVHAMALKDMEPPVNHRPGTLTFQCNICSATDVIHLPGLTREGISCARCRSSARTRAIVRAVSVELFGKNLPLPDFPTRKDLRGLGTSDSEHYAVPLAQKFDYQNTYLHREPFLDLSARTPVSLIDSNDFVISSEVFEHIPPPVSRAFENVWKMLKPGGVLVLTVPYSTQAETVEHFPELNEFSIVEKDGSFVLRNKTKAGVVQEFNDLVFHEGPGSTLEMRVFAENALIQHLKDTGFADIKVHRTADLVHGIWWPEPWSLPISARKPNRPSNSRPR